VRETNAINHMILILIDTTKIMLSNPLPPLNNLQPHKKIVPFTDAI